MITSVGAKSGKLRKNPVMRVEKDGLYVAIASKSGAPENPRGYANFVAHPVVDLQDGARAEALPRAHRGGRGAPSVVGPRRRDLSDLRVVPGADSTSRGESSCNRAGATIVAQPGSE